MSEIVQAGFFDTGHENNEIVVIADWGELTKDDLLQEATAYHDKLDKQELSLDSIIRFAQQEKKNVIYEKGELYAYMKGKMSYQEWLDWLKDIKVSKSSAFEYIQLSTAYRAELTSNAVGSNLSWRQIRAIHRTGEGHQILAKLESGQITQESINAEIKAAKERAEEAEKDKDELQRSFNLFKQQTEQEKKQQAERIQQELNLKNQELALLNRQKQLRDQEYAKLEAEKEQIEQSKVQILQEDTPETKAKLEEAEQKLQRLEEQAKNLKEKNKQKNEQLQQKIDRIKELTDEIQSYNRDNQLIAHNKEIRFKWRQACDAFHLGINQGFTRMVSPIDARQAFEADDWARLAELESTLKQALERLSGLRESMTSQFVDASMDYVEA